jgi:hypothetical protein
VIPSLGPHGPYPRGPRSGQGYIVPVHQHLLTSSEPLMDTPRFPGRAGYTKSRCCAGAPRLPTSGSELSLLILVSMLPSSTTENSPVAYTQFLHWRHSLHLHATDSAFSTTPPQSATGGRNFSRLTVRILLRPADLLASLTDPTLLALCRLRLLLRSFRSEEITSPAVRYDYSSNWASSTGRYFPCWISS